MQRGTDWPKNMLNRLFRIGIKFYSQASLAHAFNRTTVGDVFGGGLVRLNVFRHTVQQVQQGGGSLNVLVWHYVGPTYATSGHGRRSMAIRYMKDILRPIVQPYRQNFGGIRLNRRQFSTSSCTSCERVPS